jgi:hypothetical protein
LYPGFTPPPELPSWIQCKLCGTNEPEFSNHQSSPSYTKEI